MREFNECLNNCGLIQAPKYGLEFSWCNNRAGKKRILCNLDSAVLNDKWLELYPSRGYKVGVRSISDHGILYGANVDIPKPKNIPFRALKVWKSHPDFLQQIQASWNTMIKGNPIFIFMSKLKILKKEIQLWNWNTFGDVIKKLKQAEEQVLQATLLSNKNPENTVLLNNLVTARGKQEVLIEQQKEINQQKSRVKWLKEGASNSNFFHINMKLRQTQNAIVELEDENGNIVVDQQKIADILINHFEEKFKFQEVRYNQEFFQDIPQLVSEEENMFLDAIASDEEVKNAVFDLDPDSAPGPDGFAGWFYRYAWKIMGKDLTKAIKYCWRGGFIPQGFNIISSRFGSLIQKIVSPQQGAFIKGRNIQEQIVLASELVNELEIKRRGGNLGIKLDISQAYDSLSWEFLLQVMRNFGFSEKGITWLHTLLKSARISVLLNGDPAGYFQVGRGIRQDDMFLLCNGDKRNVKKIAALLKDYEDASGQIFNLAKRDPAKRKSITLKWDKVCSPFEEGGLGLRRLEIMNKPLLMKLWRKMLNSKEEWARYFQEKFLTKNGEWIGYYKKSYILPGMKWISEDVKNFTRWIVGNGANVSVWYDIWIKEKPLCELYPENAYINQFPNMKVENLIIEGEWVMPTELLEMVSVNELPVINMVEDKIIWSGTITGEFTISSVVECIRTKYPKVSWSSQWVKFGENAAFIAFKELWFQRNKSVYEDEVFNEHNIKTRILKLTADVNYSLMAPITSGATKRDVVEAVNMYMCEGIASSRKRKAKNTTDDPDLKKRINSRNFRVTVTITSEIINK
ncbi:uncharacterized protein LOC113360434 [Papaver somniferum]|uniref:uncharacterized protein LOC113360434 n=1 Tax=Papaver somniferum TaxID=3469 RepID=UPI000E6F6B1C|nr:uncharacterized protein LOC113360434 [Papaver somniferum]